MAETSNGIDAVKARRYVKEHERIDAECESIMMAAAAKCRPLREQQKDWRQKAADDGIPKAALKTMLRERMLLGLIAKNNKKVEDADEKAILEDLRSKLYAVRDLPLFTSAISEQEKKAAEAEKPKPKAKATTASPGIGGDVLAGFVGDMSDDIPGDEPANDQPVH